MPLWAESIGDWLVWLRSAGRTEATLKQRDYQIRRFAADHPAGPWSVAAGDLVRWLGGLGCGPATLDGYRAALRIFYAWGHAAGRIAENPARELPAIRLPRGRPRPIDDEVYRAALERATPRVRLMLRLGRQAGLRRDEIARVHRRDLVRDLAGWSLRVVGKGGHTRVVPLPDELAAELAEVDGWAFPGHTDGHLSRYQVGRLLRGVLAGRATPHQLRHAAASRVHAASGGDIRLVQEFLGHASVATTQRYVPVDDDALRAAVIAAA